MQNNLPSEIVNSKTVLEFKTKLDKLWKDSRYDLSEIYLYITITGSDNKKNGKQMGKTSLWGLISFPMTTSKTTSKTAWMI